MISPFSKYKAVIFDLDNTLYDERDYLYPAYRSVASVVSGGDGQEEEMTAYLIRTFESEGRNKLFDRLKETFPGKQTDLQTMLQALRFHRMDRTLPLYPKMKILLQELLKAGKKIAVLTNGNVLQQKNKVDQIDWDGMNTSIRFYYANEIEKKPSPAGILQFLSQTGFSPADVVFVGDGAEDRSASEAAGVHFIDAGDLK